MKKKLPFAFAAPEIKRPLLIVLGIPPVPTQKCTRLLRESCLTKENSSRTSPDWLQYYTKCERFESLSGHVYLAVLLAVFPLPRVPTTSVGQYQGALLSSADSRRNKT